MSIFLENVKEALEADNITELEALYLIFLKDDIGFPIEAESLKKLIENDFVKSGVVSSSMFSQVRETSNLKGTIKANYMNDISKETVRRLAQMFCMRNPETGLVILPGDKDDVNPVHTTADKYLKGEGLVAYHFIIFLYLFPIKSPFNKRWEKHFTGVPYTGAKIRTRSKITGSMFLKSIKKKDMGAFLYGTYLYVSSTVQGTKCFITTMPKYMKEFEEWYYIAKELIETAESVEELFKRKDLNKEGRVNISL